MLGSARGEPDGGGEVSGDGSRIRPRAYVTLSELRDSWWQLPP